MTRTANERRPDVATMALVNGGHQRGWYVSLRNRLREPSRRLARDDGAVHAMPNPGLQRGGLHVVTLDEHAVTSGAQVTAVADADTDVLDVADGIAATLRYR